MVACGGLRLLAEELSGPRRGWVGELRAGGGQSGTDTGAIGGRVLSAAGALVKRAGCSLARRGLGRRRLIIEAREWGVTRYDWVRSVG